MPGKIAMAARQNRPFVIRDHREWLYTGIGFVSAFSSEITKVMHFEDFVIAERVSRHLAGQGVEATCRRASYEECKRLSPPSIAALAKGEKLVQLRPPYSARSPRASWCAPADTSIYWPHR